MTKIYKNLLISLLVGALTCSLAWAEKKPDDGSKKETAAKHKMENTNPSPDTRKHKMENTNPSPDARKHKMENTNPTGN